MSRPFLREGSPPGPAVYPAAMPFTWSRTWPDARNDILGRDAEYPQAYARVYKTNAFHTEKPWFWALSDGHANLGTGYEATWQEAQRVASEAWERWKAGRDRNGP